MPGQLIETILLLAKFSNLIRDRFFYSKFVNKIRTLLENYIFILNRIGDNVAQYQVNCEKAARDIEDILGMLDDLKYLNLVRFSPLFLQVQKNLLALKLELAKSRNKAPEFEVKKEESREQEKRTDKKFTPVKDFGKDHKLNQSKKKILEFIKSSPNIRTKDIINEFNALSDRTVKRNLTDLLRTGLIKKRVDSKAVYYYSSE